MAKKFLTQQEKIYLRNMKGKNIPKKVRESIFGKYNPNINLNTGEINK